MQQESSFGFIGLLLEKDGSRITWAMAWTSCLWNLTTSRQTSLARPEASRSLQLSVFIWAGSAGLVPINMLLNGFCCSFYTRAKATGLHGHFILHRYHMEDTDLSLTHYLLLGQDGYDEELPLA